MIKTPLKNLFIHAFLLNTLLNGCIVNTEKTTTSPIKADP